VKLIRLFFICVISSLKVNHAKAVKKMYLYIF
jgi:hypothetical protein